MMEHGRWTLCQEHQLFVMTTKMHNFMGRCCTDADIATQGHLSTVTHANIKLCSVVCSVVLLRLTCCRDTSSSEPASVR
jgi:hypothetical protein